MANDLRLQVLLQALDKASAPLGRISGSSKAAGDALRATRDQLRQLNQTQAALTGFRKVKNDAQASAVALKAAEQRAQQLRTEMAAADAPTRKAAAAYAKAEREVTKLKVAHHGNLIAVREGRAALTAAGISASGLGAAERKLAADTTATTQRLHAQTQALRAQAIQTQRLAALERARQANLATRAQVGGQLFGTVAAVAGVGYGLTRVIGLGNDFDYQLQLIGNTADMTAEQVADLRNKIVAASSATGQSAATVQRALGFLVAAGQDTDTASRSILAIGRTATAAGADIEDISRAAFTLTDAMNVQPEGLQKALDILSQAGKEGNVELRDMAKQLPVLGAGFRSFKMQGNEATATLAAALEIARKGAADPDEAANNMRNYMAKVLSPATLKKAQDGFGLDLYKVITDAQTHGGNPFEASIEAVMKATGGDQKKLGELFQDMQVQNFLKPVMQNWGEYQRIKAKSLAATGVTDRDFAKVSTSGKQQLDMLRNSAERLGIVFARTLAPALNRIARALGPVLDRIAAFMQAHPRLVSGITTLVVLLFGLRVALLGLRYAWTFLGGGMVTRAIVKLRSLTTAVRGAAAASTFARLRASATAAFGGLSTAARASMVAVTGVSLPVVAVGVALGAVALLVRKYWGPIKAFFGGVGTGIREGMGPALASVSKALAPLKPAWDVVSGAIGRVWRWLGRLLTPFKATQAQLDGAAAAGASFGRVLGKVLGVVVEGVTMGVRAFVWLGTSIGTAAGWIVTHVSKAIGWFRDVWAAIPGFMSGIGEGIKAPFVAAFAWITGKLDALIEKWRAIKARLGFGDDAAAPAAVRWNTGGAGDAKPPPRFAIDTRGPVKAGGGSTHSSTTNQITVNAAPGQDPHATARAVSAELDKRERAKGAQRRSRLGDLE